ncbi:hypothetical protein HY251_08915 [bacterium]|nr:hypothetical protein [bacterium]
MRLAPLVVLALLPLAFVQAVHAGATPEQAMVGAPMDAVIRRFDHADVLVAVVTSATEHATNANPPHVGLRVVTVLAGAPRPKDIEAVWDSIGHGVDWSGSGAEAAIEKWKTGACPGPAVGAKLILVGGGSPLFRANPVGRFPWTEEKQKEAVHSIEERARDRAAWDKAIKEKKAAHASKLEAWRRGATAEAIAKAAREADFVGIAKVCSGPGSDTAGFQIEKILRGEKRHAYRDGDYFATVPVTKDEVEVLSQDGTEYLVFLSEHGMDVGPSACTYVRVGLGVAVADAAARKAADGALAAAPAKEARPLLLLSLNVYDWSIPAASAHKENTENRKRLVDAFTAAARGRCNVATATLLTTFTPTKWAGDKLTEIVPGAKLALHVSLDRKCGRLATGLRLGPTEEVFKGETLPASGDELSKRACELVDRFFPASGKTDDK